MQYMGGKAKIARRLVDAILADTSCRDRWLEPFVGGGNVMEYASPQFAQSVGADLHLDLILMWQAVTAGWTPPDMSRSRYDELKNSSPSAERGYAGFGASFGGKWFGGYGVSPRDGEVWRASQRSVSRQGSVFREHGVRFVHGSFNTWEPPAGTVVYCDPPYAGTTGYSTGGFDHDGFYRTLLCWSRTCDVYVSEYGIPAHVPARLVWQREKRNVLERGDNQRTVVECLYRIG